MSKTILHHSNLILWPPRLDMKINHTRCVLCIHTVLFGTTRQLFLSSTFINQCRFYLITPDLSKKNVVWSLGSKVKLFFHLLDLIRLLSFIISSLNFNHLVFSLFLPLLCTLILDKKPLLVILVRSVWLVFFSLQGHKVISLLSPL